MTSPRDQIESLDTFIKCMPKVELHAHLNGSISDATLHKLVHLKQQQNAAWEQDGLWRKLIQPTESFTMKEGFAKFSLIHELVDTEEAAYIVTKDVIKEFAEDNVKYLELRTTPRNVPHSGMTKSSYIDSVLKGIQEASCDADIVVHLLLAIDRRTSVVDAMDTVTMAMTYMHSTDGVICGVDLSGDPYKGDARSFIPALKKARSSGLNLALHLAEVKDKEEETKDLLLLPPDRIGHGTFLHPEVGGNSELYELVRQQNIPLELCITSNLMTGTTSSADQHHLGPWLSAGHPCLICTDDKGVFSTSLSAEYCLVTRTFDLSREAVWALSEGAISHIFASSDTKKTLLAKWKQAKQEAFSEKT